MSSIWAFNYLNEAHSHSWPSLVAQTGKNPPAMGKTWVRSLGWEDSLEESTAIHSSILENSHGQRSLAGYSSWGGKESDTTERLNTHNIFPIHTSKIMEAYVPFSTHLCMAEQYLVADCKEIKMG